MKKINKRKKARKVGRSAREKREYKRRKNFRDNIERYREIRKAWAKLGGRD